MKKPQVSTVPKRLTKEEKAALEARKKCKVVEVAFPVGEEELKLDSEEGEEATFFLIRPDRHVTNLIAKLTKAGDMDKANKAVIVNCVVAGDVEYITEGHELCDEDIYYGVLEEVGKLVAKKKGRIKKS